MDNANNNNRQVDDTNSVISVQQRKLKGYLDNVSSYRVRGWAFSSEILDRPIEVDVIIDGQRYGTFTADLYREDLRSKGFGNGHKGFEILLPSELRDGKQHEVSVKFCGTSIDLPGSPYIFYTVIDDDILGTKNLEAWFTSREDSKQYIETSDILITSNVISLPDVSGKKAADRKALQVKVLKPNYSSSEPVEVVRFCLLNAKALEGEIFTLAGSIQANESTNIGIEVSLIQVGSNVATDTAINVIYNNSLEVERSVSTFNYTIAIPAIYLNQKEPSLVVSVKTPVNRMLKTIEILGLNFGHISSSSSNLQRASNEQAAAFTYGDNNQHNAYHKSNFLNNGQFRLNSISGGQNLAPESWKVIAGRGGELSYEFTDDFDSKQDNGVNVLPHRYLNFRIQRNEYYCRLVQEFIPSDEDSFQKKLAKNSKLSLELFIRKANNSDLSVKIFLLARNATNQEFPLFLSSKYKPQDQWQKLFYEVEAIDYVESIKGDIKVYFVIEVTGTGDLHLANCWLGGQFSVIPIRKLSIEEDKSRLNWLYHRYLATVESRALPHEAFIKIITLIPLNLQYGLPEIEAVTKSVYSVAKPSYCIYICIINNDSSQSQKFAEQLTQNLNTKRLLEPVSQKISYGFFSNEDEVELSQILTIQENSYLLVINSGDELRSDFSEYIDASVENWSKEGSSTYPDLIVFDHDYQTINGIRVNPCFKPGISSHLLLEYDYIERGACFSCRVLFQKEFDRERPFLVKRSGVRHLLMRFLDLHQSVLKIDQILLHQSFQYQDIERQFESNLQFIEDYLSKYPRKYKSQVIDNGNRTSVRYLLPDNPLVSIIIPFKDKVSLLKACIDSIVNRSSYENIEIILINNQSSDGETFKYLDKIVDNSKIHLIDYSQPFNYSKVNNIGAKFASGEFLIFLNNDTEVLTPDWIEWLIGFAALPDTGFSGAKLHFADGTLQHAGIVLGVMGLANHVLAGQHDIFCDPMLAFYTRDVTAVTAAACCIKADRFWEIGAFDENFILTGNDVEINLRALAYEYRNVIVPSAQLFHFEKKTRKEVSIYPRDIQKSLQTYEPYLSQGDSFWNKCISTQSATWVPRSLCELTAFDIRCRAAYQRRQVMLQRNTGSDTGFLATYDLDKQTIEDNIRLNADFLNNPRPKIERIAWFVPDIQHIYRGGIYTAFRLANHLWETHKVQSFFVICSSKPPSLEHISQQCADAFPSAPFSLYHFDPDGGTTTSIPYADIGICTLWTTAYVLAHYKKCKGKFYLMQDYEPLFLANGAGYGLVEQSYRLGFIGICNSQGVGESYKSYGNQSILNFTPAVDHKIFYPPKVWNNKPLRIIFYGRPNNPRNVFSLGIHALAEIKGIYRDSVEIISVGAAFDSSSYKVDGLIHNAGLLPNIQTVAALYRSADIGLVFMQSKHPSYQPIEYMASGCVTITNLNEANTWLLQDRENCLLTPITLTATVETIAEAIENQDLREKIIKNGLQTVRDLDWNRVERSVANFILRGSF